MGVTAVGWTLCLVVLAGGGYRLARTKQLAADILDR